jgi:Phytanoyl-CoA dioxygenase (PhyH)
MKLKSNGHELDTRSDKLGELRDSSAVAEDVEALRARIAEDGYLFLPGYLDREIVMAAREEIFSKWAAVGAIDMSYPLLEGIAAPPSERKEFDQAAFSRDLRTGPALRALCHRGRILRFFERFLGGEVRPLDYIWIRTVRVGGATGCHYDRVYMGRGTLNLYTSWIPLGDVPRTDGALLILENSHRLEELKSSYGAIDVDRDRANNPYGGGMLSRDPVEMQERFGGRWLTTDFRAGDLLVFTMFTLHCSLDNQSPVNRIRLSSDSRYQLASEPADERWIGADPIAHGPAAQR